MNKKKFCLEAIMNNLKLYNLEGKITLNRVEWKGIPHVVDSIYLEKGFEDAKILFII